MENPVFNYRPLPPCLKIGESEIEGQGLFTTDYIPEGVLLGISHHESYGVIIRTPLGGFINHSEDPNCEKVKIDNMYFLKTLRPILHEKEITLKYTDLCSQKDC